MKHAKWIVIAVALMLCGCSEDDEQRLPSYITELVEANANGKKEISSITLDDGTSYQLANAVVSSTADTIYRCLCMFEVTDDAKAKVYSISKVFSPHAVVDSLLETHQTDPVKLVSSWTTAKYLNARIGVLTTGVGSHTFAFSEDSIRVDADGTRHAFFTFRHSRPEEDAESYTSTKYLSLPLYDYPDCQRFTLSVHTYDGMVDIEAIR